MTVNFVYDQRNKELDWYASSYKPVFDSHVDPILKHLPDARKVQEPVEGEVNVRFFHFMRNKHGVFMSHGIADKNWRTPDKLYGFSHVCVSGPGWRDRYIQWGLHPDRLLMVGYPKLDVLFPAPEGEGVLWAPTHAGTHSYPSSYYGIEATLPHLSFDVKVAPHPRNRPVKATTLGELSDARVVIADCGSTVYEAWALGKPVVFPDWLVERKVMARWPGSYEAQIYDNRIGRHAKNEKELDRLVKEALDDGITKAEEQFIEKILPREFRGVSGKMAAEALAGVPDPKPITLPAKFVSDRYPRLAVVTPSGRTVRFNNGKLTTRDAEVAEYLANSMLPIVPVEVTDERP